MFGIDFGDVLQTYGAYRSAKENRESAERLQQNNEALQREFAQHGIRWKVDDAKAAGLHPLYALGGSGSSYTPSAIIGGSSPVGEAMQTMGQNLSRSARAVMTPEEKLLQDLQIQEVRSRIKENDARANLLDAQASVTGQQKSPGMPSGAVIHSPAGTFKTGPFTPAQTVQDEYGDLVENVYGMSRVAAESTKGFWEAVERQNPWWLRAIRKIPTGSDVVYREKLRRAARQYDYKR